MREFGVPRWAAMTATALLLIALVVVIFRLGNQASAGVALDDPVVWIEDGARGRILQVNGSTREITAQIDVGDAGDSIIAIPKERDAVFFNRTTGAVGTIGAVSLAVDNEDVLETSAGPVTGEELELLADFDASTQAFVISEDRTLVVEPGSNVQSFIATPDGIGDTVVDARGELLMVTPDGRQVLRSGENGLETFTALPEPIAGSSQRPQIVRADDAVFVVDPERRTVNEIDEDGELQSPTCVSGSLSNILVGATHLTSSAGVQRVLAHDAAAGILSVSEPGRSDCYSIEIEDSGDTYGAPVAVDGTAFLPNYSNGRIDIIDLDERVMLRSVGFSSVRGRPFELEVFDNAVWANEPSGIRASVVTRDGAEPFSKVLRFAFSESDGEEVIDGENTIIAGGNSDSEERTFGSSGEEVAGEGEGQAVGDGGGTAGGDAEDGTFEGTGLDQPDDAPPVVVQGVDAVDVPLSELSALFEFSADTVSVGETVRFTDTSSGNPTQWSWTFGDGSTGTDPEVVKAWDTEGEKLVELLVTDASGESSRASAIITVVAEDTLRRPVAQFGFDTGTAEVGQTITFDNQSTGDPDSLIWDFGDGSQDTGEVVEHAFSTPGTFTVTLTASNAAGSDVRVGTITIIDAVLPPVAVIGAGQRAITTGTVLELVSESTNSPTSVLWDFGDGTFDSGTEVRKAWTRPGTYRVRLTVENSAGSNSTFTDVVVSDPVVRPVARFDQSSLETIVGEPITFGDISLNNPTRLLWEFGDGTTATEANVTKIWDTPGQYTVTLTATNEQGPDTVTKTVTVFPPPPDPPVAAFRVSNATVPVNTVVGFTDQSTNDPAEWLWDFGDGTTSTAESPPHAFSSPGTYEVTLTVTNVSGSDSTSQTIVVIDPPVASFTRAIDELEVAFTDTSLNDPTEWAWDFGDGTSSTVQNPTKTYVAAGTYVVSLIVGNDAGASSPFTSTVVVAEAPVAGFTAADTGLSVVLTDTSANDPVSWSWDFGDGTTSTSQNPSHTYATPDTYVVSLTVTNSAGSDVEESSISVDIAPPVAAFTCTIAGAGVSCNGSPSSGVDTWAWSAPDAISAVGTTTATPAFTFPATGAYDITLTVTNTSGVPDSDTQTINVVVPQPPTITTISETSNAAGTVELLATATNAPTSWSWTTTGPGTVVSGGATDSPTIEYTASGTYTVTAIATNAEGPSAPEMIDVTVTVGTPPTVTDITTAPGAAGEVDLAATITGAPVTYAWTVTGGATLSSATAATPTLSGPDGTYNVSVVVTNAAGASAPYDEDITISNVVAPTVSTISAVNGGTGIIDLSSNAAGSPITYAWTPAAVAPSAAAAPSITVAVDQTYTIGVTVSNGADNDSATLVIDTNITVGFTGGAGATAGSPVAFSNTSASANGLTYVWDFNGEGTSTAANPSFTFAAAGSKDVTLTVTDSLTGLSKSVTNTITVS